MRKIGIVVQMTPTVADVSELLDFNYKLFDKATMIVTMKMLLK